MEMWKCIKACDDIGFTVGKEYKTTPYGRLIDDEGERRLRPSVYNAMKFEIEFCLVEKLSENE